MAETAIPVYFCSLSDGISVPLMTTTGVALLQVSYSGVTVPALTLADVISNDVSSFEEGNAC